jgi:DNA-binding NtrC family response regulator
MTLVANCPATHHPSQRSLTGTSVLVAEDDATIGMYIEELLWDAGCIVLGPVVSVTNALAALETQRPEVALIHHTLADGTVAPVATALTKRGVPFALRTGADDLELADGLTFAPRVAKPFGSGAVEQLLRELLDRSRELGQELHAARGCSSPP